MINQSTELTITGAGKEIYDYSLSWLNKTSIRRPCSGFIFTEGPVWHPQGFFLFSDTPANKIYRLTIQGNISLYLENSGLTGNPHDELSDQLGSNGIAIDKNGNIIICQHGNHAIAQLNAGNELSVVVDQYNGRLLNSPNDIIINTAGTMYFTDPPYGLSGQVLHPASFQPAAGIFRFDERGLRLIGTELQYPNGLFFSADEKYLFVSSNHPEDPGILRYKLNTHGDACYDGVFTDQQADGMKAGPDNNIYLATDDGVLIVSPQGKKLARIRLPEIPSNLCWGGAGQNILLVTARTSIYFITIPTEKK